LSSAFFIIPVISSFMNNKFKDTIVLSQIFLYNCLIEIKRKGK